MGVSTKRGIYKDERLQQILRTAAALFYKNGYAQTTTRQIAQACGLSQSNLYYYVKSKEDFFDLFVEMTTGTFEEYDEEIRSQLPGISSAEALKRKIREGLILIDGIQDMMLFWYRESGTMGRRRLGQLIEQEFKSNELIEKIIKEGRKAGEFKVADAGLAAYQILMLEHMWALKRWHLRKKYTLEEYIQKCQEAALAIALGTQRAESTEKPVHPTLKPYPPVRKR
jgi:AcrR family transcriptional regulator